MKCQRCDEPYLPANKNQRKYCSNRCRCLAANRAYRQRPKGKATESAANARCYKKRMLTKVRKWVDGVYTWVPRPA